MTRATALLIALTGAACAQSSFGVGTPSAQATCAFGLVHSTPFSKDCAMPSSPFTISVPFKGRGSVDLHRFGTGGRVTTRDLYLTREDMLALGIESTDGESGFRPLPDNVTIPIQQLFR